MPGRTVDGTDAGCSREKRAPLLDSPVDVSAPKLIQSKVIADYVVAWMEIARMHVMGDGYIEVSQLAGDIAQHEPGHVGIRLELRGPFKKRPGRFRTEPLPLPQTFVDQFARARRRIRCGRGNRRLGGCTGCTGCRSCVG